MVFSCSYGTQRSCCSAGEAVVLAVAMVLREAVVLLVKLWF